LPGSAAAATKDVYVGTARFVKHTGKENLAGTEGGPADEAFALSGTASVQAVDAARYVHKAAPVVAGIGEDRGFDEFSVFQEYAADRAAPGRAGMAFTGNIGHRFVEMPSGRMAPLFPRTVRPAGAEEKGKAKPEEDKADKGKVE
jgi:hypothetical protein